MKERLITLLGAALAFYLMVMLMFPAPSETKDAASLATTEDRGKHGLFALHMWLQDSGIATLSMRDRYKALSTQINLPESGNLLIISLPLRMQARNNELNELQTWITNGNSVLLLTALSDWPEWAPRQADDSINHVINRMGFTASYVDTKETDEKKSENKKKPVTSKKPDTAELEKQKPELLPAPLATTIEHPLLSGVKQLDAEWLSSEWRDWELDSDDTRTSLVLLKDKLTNLPAFWQARVGSGTLYISKYADLFSNQRINKADNARFFTNLVRYATSSGGHVIFDDMHQGLSTLYDPDAFYGDSRLHHTLLFLLMLWLVYVLGHTNRFRAPQERKRAVHLSDHVKALGGLFARRLHSAAIAQRMLFHFYNEVRKIYGLPQNGQPVWPQLESNIKVEADVLRHVQHNHNRAENRKRINLIKLAQQLHRIREALS